MSNINTGVKWVAFYREAPIIPDYITVINTEQQDSKPKYEQRN